MLRPGSRVQTQVQARLILFDPPTGCFLEQVVFPNTTNSTQKSSAAGEGNRPENRARRREKDRPQHMEGWVGRAAARRGGVRSRKKQGMYGSIPYREKEKKKRKKKERKKEEERQAHV